MSDLELQNIIDTNKALLVELGLKSPNHQTSTEIDILCGYINREYKLVFGE